MTTEVEQTRRELKKKEEQYIELRALKLKSENDLTKYHREALEDIEKT